MFGNHHQTTSGGDSLGYPLQNGRQITNRHTFLQQILQIIGIAAVSKQEIEQALQLDWVDFEDSVQYAVAYQQNMDGIVTRNPKDYQNAKLKIWQPEQLLQHFNVD